MSVADICGQNSISDTTFYKWKSKYGGLEVSEARRLKLLEQKNARLKRLVAEQALDVAVLREVLQKTRRASRTQRVPWFMQSRNMATPSGRHVD